MIDAAIEDIPEELLEESAKAEKPRELSRQIVSIEEVPEPYRQRFLEAERTGEQATIALKDAPEEDIPEDLLAGGEPIDWEGDIEPQRIEKAFMYSKLLGIPFSEISLRDVDEYDRQFKQNQAKLELSLAKKKADGTLTVADALTGLEIDGYRQFHKLPELIDERFKGEITALTPEEEARSRTVYAPTEEEAFLSTMERLGERLKEKGITPKGGMPIWGGTFLREKAGETAQEHKKRLQTLEAMQKAGYRVGGLETGGEEVTEVTRLNTIEGSAVRTLTSFLYGVGMPIEVPEISDQSFEESISRVVAEFAGMYYGPFKLGGALIGTAPAKLPRLYERFKTLPKSLQYFHKAGTYLGTGMTLSVLSHGSTPDESWGDFTKRVGETAAASYATGAFYSVMGFTKPLAQAVFTKLGFGATSKAAGLATQVGVGTAILDYVAAKKAKKGTFMIDDVYKGIRDGTINPRDLSDYALVKTMDAFFLFKQPNSFEAINQISRLTGKSNVDIAANAMRDPELRKDLPSSLLLEWQPTPTKLAERGGKIYVSPEGKAEIAGDINVSKRKLRKKPKITEESKVWMERGVPRRHWTVEEAQADLKDLIAERKAAEAEVEKRELAELPGEEGRNVLQIAQTIKEGKEFESKDERFKLMDIMIDKVNRGELLTQNEIGEIIRIFEIEPTKKPLDVVERWIRKNPEEYDDFQRGGAAGPEKPPVLPVVEGIDVSKLTPEQKDALVKGYGELLKQTETGIKETEESFGIRQPKAEKVMPEGLSDTIASRLKTGDKTALEDLQKAVDAYGADIVNDRVGNKIAAETDEFKLLKEDYYRIMQKPSAEALKKAKAEARVERGVEELKDIDKLYMGVNPFKSIKTLGEWLDSVSERHATAVDKIEADSIESDSRKFETAFSRMTPEQTEDAQMAMLKDLGVIAEIPKTGAEKKKIINEELRDPFWNKTFKSEVQFLNDLSQQSTAVTNEYKRKLEFLGKIKISKEMEDVAWMSNEAQRAVGLDTLPKEEQEALKQIWSANRWMRNKFMECAKNAKDPKTGKNIFAETAKRDGYADVNKWIEDNIGIHSKNQFYLPMMRNVEGEADIVLWVKDPKTGKTLHSENVETEKDADERSIQLKNQYGIEPKQFRASDAREFKFPEVVELIHDLPYVKNILKGKALTPEDIANNKEFVDLLHGEYLKIWARGRLAPREVIPGYERDIKKVLNAYADSFPRSFIRRFNSKGIQHEIDKIPSIIDKSYAKRLSDYYLGRQDYEGKINRFSRILIYNWNLAFKPSFGLLNLTQRGITTIWRAMADDGLRGAGMAMKAQAKEADFWVELSAKRIKGEKRLTTRDAVMQTKIFNPQEKETLVKLIDRNILTTLRSIEIGGRSRFNRYINIFGNLSEKSNRFMSGLTAIEIGMKKDLKGDALYRYAVDFIHGTQWLYGKESRPQIGRGWKAPLFVFKKYVINDIMFMKDLYGRNTSAFTGALAMRVLASGAAGIYGAGTLEDILDIIMPKIYPDWKIKKYDWIQEHKTLYYGLPSKTGLTGSILFGQGELFDIAALPFAMGTFRDFKSAWEHGADSVEWKIFLERHTPTMPKHIITMLRNPKGFEERNIFGKKRLTEDDIDRLPKEIRARARDIYELMPEDKPIHEKVLYAIGFSTQTETDFYLAADAIKSSQRQVSVQKTTLHKEIAEAIDADDYDREWQLRDRAERKELTLNEDAIRQQLKKIRRSED